MPYYSLWIADEDRTLPVEPARDRQDAVTIFAEQLGRRLTLAGAEGVVAPYTLGESRDLIHWVETNIPVWEVSN